MPVYTVHAPLTDANVKLPADRVVFVRDGFHIWAAIAGVWWFAFHRLWLALLGYVVLILLIEGGLQVLHVGAGIVLIVMFLIALLTGFEAANVQRWTLSRGKWRQLNVVVAEDREAAERRFFDRWIDGSVVSDDSNPIDRGSPPPTRPLPRVSGAHPDSHDGVMGLFPQPGASR